MKYQYAPQMKLKSSDLEPPYMFTLFILRTVTKLMIWKTNTHTYNTYNYTVVV